MVIGYRLVVIDILVKSYRLVVIDAKSGSRTAIIQRVALNSHLNSHFNSHFYSHFYFQFFSLSFAQGERERGFEGRLSRSSKDFLRSSKRRGEPSPGPRSSLKGLLPVFLRGKALLSEGESERCASEPPSAPSFLRCAAI